MTIKNALTRRLSKKLKTVKTLDEIDTLKINIEKTTLIQVKTSCNTSGLNQRKKTFVPPRLNCLIRISMEIYTITHDHLCFVYTQTPSTLSY